MNPARATVGRIFVSATLAVMLGTGAPVWAQAADTVELERRLEHSARLIEALTKRLEQLEKQIAAPKAPAPAAAATPTPAPAASSLAPATPTNKGETTGSEVPSSISRDLRDPGLVVHGFADVGLSKLRNAVPGQRDGFVVGSLDLYLTPEFGANVKTLVELIFETSADGETVADLERAQIGYTFHDALTLWLGRFHTPVGYWNMAFHHGAQIQTSILRPRMLEFEDGGGILPAHTTGVWANGGVRLGSGKLLYNLYAGNGTRIANGLLDPNAAGDDNGNKVLGFGLGYRFGDGLAGLSLGVNGLRQTVGAYDAADTLTSQTRLGILGGHAVYDNNDWEIVGEYYRFRNTDLSGSSGRHGSWTGYAQVGRTFQERWMPYYRFERASLDQTDNYFLAQNNGRSYSRNLLGVRYNTDPRAALKLEFNRTNDRGAGNVVDELRFQYAVSF